MIALSSVLALILIASAHYDGFHNAIFKCGDAQSVTSMGMHFTPDGMTINCPVHTHLTGESLTGSTTNYRVICECDK
jgi:hypothetical protein